MLFSLVYLVQYMLCYFPLICVFLDVYELLCFKMFNLCI